MLMPYSNAVSVNTPVEIIGKPGDILTYEWQVGTNSSFRKLNLTDTYINNETNLILQFDNFEADSVSAFNLTSANQTENVLTGNISQDLFSDVSFFNFYQPLNMNFSASQQEFEEFQNAFAEEDKIKMNISIRSDGLSLKMVMYYRLIIFIKVMEMELFYSSTRVLLLARTKMINPQSSEEGELICRILPNLSTPEGVFEDPFNPLNLTSISDELSGDSPDEFDNSGKLLLIDTRGIIILTSIGLGFVGVIVLFIKLIKNRRKKKSLHL